MCVCVCVFVCVYIYIYIYICFGLMSRLFVNGQGDWSSILGRVIPKTQKNGI